MVVQAEGYVSDVPYVRVFIPHLAPAWLDHVAIVCGVAPPMRNERFAWCDLGCGQGVTAAMLAAMHPAGQFHGIDAMSGHIDHARRLAGEADVPNVNFHAADFASAADLALPKFDYIVAHGVYSWVGAQVRANMRLFIDRNLARGGLVYLSYNAMPGRAADLPFQRLVRAIGETCTGDSTERAATALTIVDAFLELKAPALVTSPMLSAFKQHKDRCALTYLTHECMGQHWNPLFVTEVRSDMETIGLKPVGSATLIENHDSLVLGQAARDALAGIDDEHVRELVRDYFINQFFRRDVYVREGNPLNEREQRQRLLANGFALTRGAGRIEYRLRTPAGDLTFDNSAARAIIAVLTAGPCRLGSIIEQCRVAAKDVVANVLVLCASNQIRPVEPVPASVTKMNAVISRQLGGREEILHLSLPCGTAVDIDDKLHALLRGETVDGHEFDEQRAFLTAHGI